MEEKELKTSPTQRAFIIVIAVIMLGSIIAGYVGIVMNGSKSSSETGIDEATLARYSDEYDEKLTVFEVLTSDDFNVFKNYLGEVKSYDEEYANSNGIYHRDLLVGSGKELVEGDTDYLAYYVGYCADGSIFDSSLDSKTDATAFTKAIDASLGMIEGWNEAVVGMKLGGVRKITVPGEKAYGENMEICGGYNKPLKFLLMAISKDGEIGEAAKELDTAYMKLQYAYYGIDYDAQM